MKKFELGIKENTKWQNDELENAYKSICTILGGRLTVSPEDYPPSEWRQYRQNTLSLTTIRDLIEILINKTI